MEIISIVITVFNKSNFIEDCINSILKQTYPNIEIIVVNDKSTDDSINKVRKINDSRIRILENEENSGPSFSRNKGIKNSKGELITTLDGDDTFINKEKLQKEYELLKAKGLNSVAFSNIIRLNIKGKNKERMGKNSNIKEGYIFDHLYKSKFEEQKSKLFIPRDFLAHKETYINSGLYDESMHLLEDYDLKLRIAKNHPYYYTGIDGVGYRQVKNGLSKQARFKRNKALSYIREKHKK